MIHRTRFVRRCKAEGLVAFNTTDLCFWRTPVKYVLWWCANQEAVCIVPNTHDALAPGNRTRSAVASFSDPITGLDEAIATYNLLNP